MFSLRGGLLGSLLMMMASAGDGCSCESTWGASLWGFAFGAFVTFILVEYRKRFVLPFTWELFSVHDLGHPVVTLAKADTKYAEREKALFPVPSDEFRRQMHEIVEFIIDYVRNPNQFKVMTDQNAGDTRRLLPHVMPDNAEPFEAVLSDLRKIIIPGLLHWQHPRFHGYFGSGFSYPDVLGETLISGMAVIPFAWVGSPSLAELECTVVNWMGRAIGLPERLLFTENAGTSPGGGVLFYGASEAIFCSLMVARDRKLRELVPDTMEKGKRREEMTKMLPLLVAYTSREAHSAIEKACKMAMIRLRTVKPSGKDFGLRARRLEEQINRDKADGLIPFHLHGTLGTTATAAMDNLEELGVVAEKHGLWFHVDGAYGGSALICPEYRYLAKGIERVDSFNLNMHKMMLMSTPLTMFWCHSQLAVKETFVVDPTYLQLSKDGVADFRHWGIMLSRRALCLKAWFCMRLYGVENIREYIRRMARNANRFRRHIEKDGRFEIVGQPILSLVVFRFKGRDDEESNRITRELAKYINSSTRLFVTHAKPMEMDVIRVNMSHQLSLDDDVDESYRLLCELTEEFLNSTTEPITQRYLADVQSRLVGSPGLSFGNTSTRTGRAHTSRHEVSVDVIDALKRKQKKSTLREGAKQA